MAYSTLNDKDDLAIIGKSPVVRKFPFTPGIDLAGTVINSRHPGNACASTKYSGVVTACGVTLAGIDSVMAPRAGRVAAWARLARDLDAVQLEHMTREVNLADAIGFGAEILAWQVRGRVVVNVNG